MKNRIFEIILGIALAMGVYACWPETKQAGQVLIPLYTTEEQQVEAVARGRTLIIDGKGGPITDEVLIEIAKER